MNHNIITLFSTRIIQLLCYGFLSVILALYLAQAGLPEPQIGMLFTLTLVGDAGISLWLTTSAIDPVESGPWPKVRASHEEVQTFQDRVARRLSSRFR
jgi:hypothetical protein